MHVKWHVFIQNSVFLYRQRCTPALLYFNDHKRCISRSSSYFSCLNMAETTEEQRNVLLCVDGSEHSERAFNCKYSKIIQHTLPSQRGTRLNLERTPVIVIAFQLNYQLNSCSILNLLTSQNVLNFIDYLLSLISALFNVGTLKLSSRTSYRTSVIMQGVYRKDALL